jgi:hypothetical protein
MAVALPNAAPNLHPKVGIAVVRITARIRISSRTSTVDSSPGPRLESVLVTNIEQPSAEDDIEEVARLAAAGNRVTDPELLSRIHERSDALRREMLRSQGLTNIAVDLVREIRNEE